MADDLSFSLNRVFSARYRPTRDAEAFLEELRRSLVTGEKYRVARLAIARSLVEPGDLDLVTRGTDMGSAIEGTHLFGEDTSTWACLIVEASSRRATNQEEFRQLVEAHWNRGARLLQRDHEAVKGREVEFVIRLAELAGVATGEGAVSGDGSASSHGSGRITVRVGEVGLEIRTNTSVDVVLNGPGMSPHLAIMGKTRSGKTRTGITMAERIVRDADLPMLFIDPKGEFVKNGGFVTKSEWGGKTLADRFPGTEPLEVPLQPIPLDFMALPTRATSAAISQAAIAFRDSFQKCIRSKGDVAMDNLREAVKKLIESSRAPVSLERIREAVKDANVEAGRKKDTVEAKLNELTSLKLFEPLMSPAQFFRKRWVVGLDAASAETKRLVMFLLLDALANYLLSLEDSATDALGHRSLRHLLVVDEAKEILEYRHGALSSLVRKSAAKGGVVMLFSQSPEDFEQEEDDFLQQMGTIAVFASTSKSVKNLRGALGKRVNPEDFGDSQLGRGIALVKITHRDATKVLAWK